MELYNDAAIPGDFLHGTSEQCPSLCEGLWVSNPRLQKSTGADCDFSAGYFQDGQDSFLSSLNAAIDSKSYLDIFDEFINYPPRSSTRSPTVELPSPRPQPSPSQLQCRKCQQEFPSVKKALQHVAETHRLADSGHWRCVEPKCDRSFISDKDLCRHLRDVHLDLKYACSCGIRQRRDHHMPHIQDSGRRCKPIGPYICVCGTRTDSDTPTGLGDHLKHVTDVLFTCSCGQRHAVADHLSHLQHHQCRRGSFYICHCGKRTDSHTDTGLEEHRHHVEEYCPHGPSYGLNGQPRKRGRPRKMNDESIQRRMY